MVKRGALENRLEPFYYVPSIVELENKIRGIANGKLKDYALKMSSGATPLKSEEEKYYSDAENGIPFIRVQNLNDTNELSLDDLKYINYETHEKDLKRSQVNENDLLVKITGVGRMAVACVPPLGFEGNTNQHLVVIKTKDRLTSATLATYLNTDIVEKLASRRSTGGTRPALDYTSLKSIPVIFKPEIVDLMNKAVEKKSKKETEAKELLVSIDAYLLEQLGIVLPDKIEEKNVFYVPFSKVQGKRFDPKPYVSANQALYESLSNSKYQKESLKNLLVQSVAGDWGIEEKKEGFEERLVIRATEFDNLYNLNLENSRVKYRFINQVKLGKMDLQVGDLLIEKSGGSENQPVGRIALITKDIANQYKLAYSNFIHKIRVSDQINPEYLFYFLKTIHNIKITDLMQSQTNGIRNLIMREYFNIPVSLPPLEIQTEIANYIRNVRERAKALETEAKEVIEKAKAEIEKMIIG